MFNFLRKKPAAKLPALRVRNTLSGTTEAFVPLKRGSVKMYNCGPTVYDRQHIGNLRPYVFADSLRRVLEAWGYQVSQVINITDVGHLVSDSDEGEDKMEQSAQRLGQSAQQIAEQVTAWWFDDLDALGIDRKKIQFPRATEYIGEIIALVRALEQKGYAYRIADGVYFDTARFAAYGKLGHVDLAGLREGARVEENPDKKNPSDFALWKLSTPGAKRQQEWDSPWGKGFPGWHIECTAMIFTLLGRQIDIHTGGVDHIPVHHNNELAQAEALTGKQYARYWMHNEFITIEGKKISKSLGNTVYLSQLIDRGFAPRALRYLYLTAHYRAPMNFTWESIEAADQALKRLRHMYLELPPSNLPVDRQFADDFYAALAEDLNTPRALARVWEMLKDPALSPAQKRVCLALADKLLALGLADKGPSASLKVIPATELPEGIRELVASREAARNGKDYAKADEFRAELESAGYVIKDTPQGPQVTKK